MIYSVITEIYYIVSFVFGQMTVRLGTLCLGRKFREEEMDRLEQGRTRSQITKINNIRYVHTGRGRR